jgi:protein-disulfide isomerase
VTSSAGRRRLLLLGGAALAALAIVVVAIVVSQGGADGNGSTAGGADRSVAAQRQEMRRLFGGIPQDGVDLGRADAPATLIEFADLQCPFCAQYAVESLPQVIRDYVRPGRLRLELRLIAFIGEDSERGAQMAAAAALQDRSWQFSDLFFHNQGAENSGYATDAFLRQLARATPDLRVERALSERNGAAAASIVRGAAARATRLGVDSTPTFYLRRGDRVQPLEPAGLDPQAFTAALDQALAGG